VSPWASSLLSVVAVSLISLVGLATLSLNEQRIRRIATVLVSFAVGALLGDAFIHLIPEMFAGEAGTLESSFLILAGMMLFFLVEKLLRHRHGPLHHRRQQAHGRPELAAINIVGDAIHNFIDGVLVAASYLASPGLGISTTLAVLLHEVPQELGDFGVLVHSGLGVRKATLVNLASACMAIVGAILALLVGGVAGSQVVQVVLPITAGGFVYIAAADLIPELQHDRSARGLLAQVSFISLGVAVMALLTRIE
jgi:zinc and cadmium transporter